MRTAGWRRANSAATVSRSAASLSATSSRAADTSGEIAPPNTIMPSGAPRAASQRGKRSSSGIINALPTGERPKIASTIRLAKASARPARAKRVGNSKSPRRPMEITRFEGLAKKPRIFERGKNIAARALHHIELTAGPALVLLHDRPRTQHPDYLFFHAA